MPVGGRRRVGIGPGLEKGVDYRRAAVHARERQRCHAVAIARVDLRAGAEQRLDDLEAVAVHGPVKGRRAIRLGCIRIRFLLEHRERRNPVAGPNSVDEAATEGIATKKHKNRKKKT